MYIVHVLVSLQNSILSVSLVSCVYVHKYNVLLGGGGGGASDSKEE